MGLVQSLIKSEGHCCVFGYLIANRNKPSLDIARYLGVSPRIIRRWKQHIHERKVLCEDLPNCRYRSSSSSTSGTGKDFSKSC